MGKVVMIRCALRGGNVPLKGASNWRSPETGVCRGCKNCSACEQSPSKKGH